MLKVKVHVPNSIRLTIPVPYSMMSIVLNKRILNKIQVNSDSNFEFTDEMIAEMKKFILLLKEYKGLTLVDVKTHDGVIVKIKL